MSLYTNQKFKVNNLRHNFGHYPVPQVCKGGIAVDIGCNNGCFLSTYKNFFKEIHAYDANYFLIQKLKQEFADNKNIFLNNYAVSDKDNEILNLVKNKHTDEDGSFAIHKKTIENFTDNWDANIVICEVKSISLDSITSKFKTIDYLKIDCETSEYEFFMNKDLSNINYIGIELHNQLGLERYTELFNFISVTHDANQPCNYREMCHQEILFTNHNLFKYR